MADEVTSILLQSGKFALKTYWREGALVEASLTRAGAPDTWLFYTTNETELMEFLGMCLDLREAALAYKAAPPPPVVEIAPPPNNRPEVFDNIAAAVQRELTEQWQVITPDSGQETTGDDADSLAAPDEQTPE